MITKEIKLTVETFCAYLAREGIDTSIICHDPENQDIYLMGNINFDELHKMLTEIELAKMMAAPAFNGPSSKLQ